MTATRGCEDAPVPAGTRWLLTDCALSNLTPFPAPLQS